VPDNLNQEQQITLKLSLPESLVLFEMLNRIWDTENETVVKHPAEQKVLWQIEGQLEKQLPVFAPDYKSLVDNALRVIASES